MKNTNELKSGIIFILILLLKFHCPAQIEVDGGNPGIKVTNAQIAGQFNGVGAGIKATNSFVGIAVEGLDNSTSVSSIGVKGMSTNGTGVSGKSTQGAGVYGESNNYRGVWGYSSNNIGIAGTSGSGTGGYFQSDSIAAQLKGHLNLESLSNNHDWRFEINSNDGYLLLFYNNIFKGSFNSATGEYGEVSDKRFKDDIATIPNGMLKEIGSLRPVSYTMKDQEDNQKTFGLIAQEVLEILPEVVNETVINNDEVLSISSIQLIPIVINGMQEQQSNQ